MTKFQTVARWSFIMLVLLGVSVYSLPADTPKDLLIISCLESPPPGYAVEKSLGEFFVTQELLSMNPFNFKKSLDENIAVAGKRAADYIKSLGGNAILGEKIQMSVTNSGANLNAYILITGEGVILKPKA